MRIKKLTHMLNVFNLLNSVKQKFQYSVKLRLFDNRMNSSNQTVVAVSSLL